MTKDPMPTTNADINLPPAVCDLAKYPKTAAFFGASQVTPRPKDTALYAGGAANRLSIVTFLRPRTPGIAFDAVCDARPAVIPECVWSAYTDNLNDKIASARTNHDDREIDTILGDNAEALMDVAPLASAILLIARVQNRCSLELATANHHPLSPAVGDRAAAARAENFIFDALTSPEWRA